MNLHKQLGIDPKTARPGDLLNAAKKHKFQAKFVKKTMCKDCGMKHKAGKHKFQEKSKKHKFVKKFVKNKSKK